MCGGADGGGQHLGSPRRPCFHRYGQHITPNLPRQPCVHRCSQYMALNSSATCIANPGSLGTDGTAGRHIRQGWLLSLQFSILSPFFVCRRSPKIHVRLYESNLNDLPVQAFKGQGGSQLKSPATIFQPKNGRPWPDPTVQIAELERPFAVPRNI